MSDGVRAVLVALREQGRVDGVIALGGSGGTSIAAPGDAGLADRGPQAHRLDHGRRRHSPVRGRERHRDALPRRGHRRHPPDLGADPRQCRGGHRRHGRGIGRASDRGTMGDPSSRPRCSVSRRRASRVARERLEALRLRGARVPRDGSRRSRDGRRWHAPGLLAGVLDITTTELADELVGGILTAGPDRLEAAGAAGHPAGRVGGRPRHGQLRSRRERPVTLRRPHVPPAQRRVTLMRTTPAEYSELGRLMAGKLGRARGPVSGLPPARWRLDDRRAGRAVPRPGRGRQPVRGAARRPPWRIDLVEMDVDINDPTFARAMADRLHGLMSERVGAIDPPRRERPRERARRRGARLRRTVAAGRV